MPRMALGQTKKTFHASFESDLATVLEVEAEGRMFCGYTKDHKEGAATFFKKREPVFTGS